MQPQAEREAAFEKEQKLSAACSTRSRQERNMADDKTKIGKQDRIRVAGGQEYEVGDIADKFDISPGDARDLIERFGNDRETLEREARKLNQ
jgi:hypothetical protein